MQNVVKDTIQSINRRIHKCYRNATPQQKQCFAAQIVHGYRNKMDAETQQTIINTMVDQYSARYRYFDHRNFRHIARDGI